MATHFECLGFPFVPGAEDGGRMAEVLRALFDGGRPLPAPGGLHAVEWGEEGGAAASAAVSVDPGSGAVEVRCLTPTFLGATRQRMRVYRTLADPACPFCDFLHGEVRIEGEERGEPLFVEIEDRRFDRAMDLRGAEVVLQANLLAQHVHAYRDEEEFLARRPDAFGPRGLAATGLGSPPHRPRARAAGEVLDARRLVNPLTGLGFLHATLDAPGGPWDVLAAEREIPGGLRAGQWLMAEGSVVARFVEGLPAP